MARCGQTASHGFAGRREYKKAARRNDRRPRPYKSILYRAEIFVSVSFHNGSSSAASLGSKLHNFMNSLNNASGNSMRGLSMLPLADKRFVTSCLMTKDSAIITLRLLSYPYGIVPLYFRMNLRMSLFRNSGLLLYNCRSVHSRREATPCKTICI